MPLSKRQKLILKAIINEFFRSKEPVGSLTLSSKHNIGVSPATLRSEMSRLVDEGYLFKEHSSSGRLPTTLGLRYFLDELFKEDEMDVLEETLFKERLFRKRFEKQRFVNEAVRILSEYTRLAAIGIVEDLVMYSGLGNFVNEPEFEDLENLQKIIQVIESDTLLPPLLRRYLGDDRQVKVLIGDEIGLDSLFNCSIVYAPFKYFRHESGFIGVIGPRRLNYRKVIPLVRKISFFIEDSIRGWE